MSLRTVLSIIQLYGGVTSAEISAGAVTNAALASNAVTGDKIDDGTITTGDIGVGEINASVLDQSDDYNFTGALQKDGVALTGGDLYFVVVDCCLDTNVADIDDGSAPNTVDGFNIVNDTTLVLAINQTQGYNNRIFITSTHGSGSNGTWTTPSSRDEDSEIPPGLRVYVRSGAKYAGATLVHTAGTLAGNNLTFTLDDSLHPTNGGEPENLAGADGSKLAFDVSVPKVAFMDVRVNGVSQPPSAWHRGVGTGSGGVDQVVFESGNAPPNGATVEAVVLYRK